MKTLDRYIVRLFVINFTILLVVLMSLFVVVDLILDLDEFLKGGQFWARKQLVQQQLQDPSLDPWTVTDAMMSRGGATELADRFEMPPAAAERLYEQTRPGTLRTAVGVVVMLFDYYAPVLVLLYVFFCGLLVVAAMGFTLSAMSRTRELTAIVASGISLYRVAAPVLVVGIALSALALPLQEWVIPEVSAKLARSKSHITHRTIKNFPVRYANDDAGHLISAAEFDPGDERLLEVTILERDQQGLTQRQITATAATWNEGNGGWVLEDGLAVTPVDTDGVFIPPQPVVFFPTQLSPTVLLARRAGNYPRLLSLAELQRMQGNEALSPAQQNSITQIIWGRFSLLVVNVLVLVMGLPFFLSRAPQNALTQGVRAAALCMTAWGAGLVTMQVSGEVLNPVAAAWLPVVLFLPVSAVLLQFVKT
jgi:lipopolysaccharide export system permease protein